MIRIPLLFLILIAAATISLPARAVAQHEHAAMDGGHGAHGAAPLSARDSAELAAQVQAVRAATARYRDHASAVADGYRRFGQESPLMGEHWYRPDLVGRPLDLQHPSTLQYVNIGGRKVLAGVAYTVYRRPGDPVPAGFAGSADAWHTHDIAHLADAATEDRPLLHGIVRRRIRNGRVGPEGRTLLTMVHAWVWLDNPDGMFAQEHRALPYLRAGLPSTWAAGADEAVAQGIALLAPGACAGEVRRTGQLARTDGAQNRMLASACEQSAARVRAALARRREAATVNAAAARAWTGYEAAHDRILRADQRARMQRILGAAMEHDMMVM
ncbi:hypothetical protein [Longimicrobium sp.]|uniref:hypothetical protein n=1 Tax=Longimicrobium sp. TaxID=2029185 RepID=UPI002BDCCB92|nr:hypothetical protein [Longimicrobium sp.]HSU13981.1 hypothetical protein [Longimicrobium sp.]